MRQKIKSIIDMITYIYWVLFITGNHSYKIYWLLSHITLTNITITKLGRFRFNSYYNNSKKLLTFIDQLNSVDDSISLINQLTTFEEVRLSMYFFDTIYDEFTNYNDFGYHVHNSIIQYIINLNNRPLSFKSYINRYSESAFGEIITLLEIYGYLKWNLNLKLLINLKITILRCLMITIYF